MAVGKECLVERFAARAIAAGANQLEVEYKDHCEEVYAMSGDWESGVGVSIAMLPSSTPEARSLVSELYNLARKRRWIKFKVHGRDCELRCHSHDSFGEEAYRVELRTSAKARGSRA